jgi:hypothetical protein
MLFLGLLFNFIMGGKISHGFLGNLKVLLLLYEKLGGLIAISRL